jgi:hypothetical protein
LVWLSPQHQLLILKCSGVNLNEVVVVGYGKTTSQALQELLNKLKLRFWSKKQIFLKQAGRLQGLINSSGQPGADATVKIRGIGSVNANSDPLYVVDGVPFIGNLSSINFSDIASTTVLKDASATSGSRGGGSNHNKGKTGASYISK